MKIQKEKNAVRNNMSPLELYQADLALERNIQAILRDTDLRKKEKRKLLKALQDETCNACLRSHVQYYLDTLQAKPAEIFLNILSFCAVAAFAGYTIMRLFEVL